MNPAILRTSYDKSRHGSVSIANNGIYSNSLSWSHCLVGMSKSKSRSKTPFIRARSNSISRSKCS